MAQDNMQVGKAKGNEDDDATLRVSDSSNGVGDESSLEYLTYEDFDFGLSDDEVRETLQSERRNSRKLVFSNVFGTDSPAEEAIEKGGFSDKSRSDAESSTRKRNESSANPERTAALGSTTKKVADVGTDPRGEGDSASPSADNKAQDSGQRTKTVLSGEEQSPSDLDSDDSMAAPVDDSFKEAESEVRKTAPQPVRKPVSRLPVIIAAGIAAIAIAIAAFTFGGSDTWGERVELGTVVFVDSGTGDSIRKSEDLVFEKGDKREYFAPKVDGYKAVEARANGKSLKLAGKDDGKDKGKVNIIEGLSPWPEDEKSEVTVLYAEVASAESAASSSAGSREAETVSEVMPSGLNAEGGLESVEVTGSAASMEGAEGAESGNSTGDQVQGSSATELSSFGESGADSEEPSSVATETELESGADADAELELEAETENESESVSEAKMATEQEAEAEQGLEAETEVAVEPQVKADLEPEPVATSSVEETPEVEAVPSDSTEEGSAESSAD